LWWSILRTGRRPTHHDAPISTTIIRVFTVPLLDNSSNSRSNLYRFKILA
jgi:hypothetical protein